jgi:FkbH-like protein
VLVCGFTPLHLETFLAAHLQQSLSGRRVLVKAGLYGDTAGTLENLRGTDAHAVALALEWPDLDARLGYRGAGKWGPAVTGEILATAKVTLDRMAAAIAAIPAAIPVVCSLPTLPLPPLFHTPGGQLGEAELELERAVLAFARGLAEHRGCSIVNGRRLAEDSPPHSRYDLKSDLLTGLPYSVAHADQVALALARLLAPAAPKKGLITDLDDTLWHGLVGEVGPENVAWDLASHQQAHGLYQKLLASLAEEGVLIGIASKNDAEVVQRALARPDLLLPLDRVFPVEVHWNAKSASVERILRTWNIAADNVVFVDDSPMELAEVAAVHPGIECVHFTSGGAYALLRRLRDLFGKPRLAAEDAYRLESIRQNVAFQQASDGAPGAESFLERAEATVTFDLDPPAGDPRILELINKTNQFNLNGIRYTEAEWRRLLDRPGAVLAAVSYRDKFGPLGKIAVLTGRQEAGALYIDSWVMSCRAFSRRIEHQFLKILFERSGTGEMVFDFRPTPKNGPLQDFFEALTGSRPAAAFRLGRDRFEENCPPLYHHVEETIPSANPWMIQSQPA